MLRKAPSLLFLLAFFLMPCIGASTHAQGPTTGRIAGTIKDQNGAVIVGAEVTVVSKATGDEQKVITDREGSYSVPLLPPGTYQLRVAARGFNTKIFDTVQVAITETTLVNADAAL